MVPMQTAFTDAFLALSAYGNLEIFDYCIDCLFFVDIVLNFNTGTDEKMFYTHIRLFLSD